MESYANQPVPSPQFAPLRTLALWASLLLGANVIISLTSFAAYLLQIMLHANYPETVQAAVNIMNDRDVDLVELPGGALQTGLLILMGSVEVFGFLIFVIAAIVFVSWLYRAYKNLRPLGSEPESKPGWAIGAWFVPFLNLVKPYQIVKETWLESDPDTVAQAAEMPASFGGSFSQARAGTPLLTAWWTCWLIGMISNNIAARLGRDINTVEQLITLCMVGLLPAVVLTAAAILAIKVVRGLTARQEERQRRLLANATPAPGYYTPPPVAPPSYA